MTHSLAAQINSLLASLILLTAFALLAQRKILGLVHLFAWQGWISAQPSAAWAPAAR